MEKQVMKMQLAWHLWQANVAVVEIANRLEIHRATVYRWLCDFRMFGLERSLERYQEAKKGNRSKRRIDPRAQLALVQIRQKYQECCGEKLQWYLEVEYGINLSISTIYRYLNKYKLVRKLKRVKHLYKRKEVFKASHPRHMIQVDTVDFGQVYAYTFIDTYTRQAQVVLKTSLKSADAASALTEAFKQFSGSILIQTDNGSEYEGDFPRAARQYCQELVRSMPYKKNDQAYIESFNRTLRKECLGWNKYKTEDITKLQQRVSNYLTFYNSYRPHLGLNMYSPNQMTTTCRI